VLTVITGPPCAGKSTYIAEHRTERDVIIDLDALAYALGYPTPQIDWDIEHPARNAARAARRDLIDQAIAGTYCTDVWIVDSRPHQVTRKIYQRAGAHIVQLDPGPDECHRRAYLDQRSASTHEHIDRWYDER